MTTLKSGSITIDVRATIVARLYFAQEFDCDIRDALNTVFDADASDGDIEGAAIKIIWAMNKAENKANGKSTANFRQWFEAHEQFSIRDCISDFLDEIVSGFLIKRTKEETSETYDMTNMAQYLTTVAKRMGWDLGDLNELTTQGFFDVVHAFAGTTEQSGNAMATPEQNELMWK